MRIGTRLPSARRTLHTVSPSTSGIDTSRITTSGAAEPARSSASAPLPAATTWYPSSPSARTSESRTARSSSAISRVCPLACVGAIGPQCRRKAVRARCTPRQAVRRRSSVIRTGQTPRPADLADAPRDRVGIGELERREPGEELLDGHPHLEAGEVGAEAAVDAEAEGGVAVLQAVDDDLVGAVEQRRVAVGRRERQQHPVVDLHRAAVEVVVLGDHAGHRHRGVGPQQLLDGHRHQLGLGDHAAPVVRVRGEVPEARADGAPRRVDAGQQQQHHRAADVLVGQLRPSSSTLQQVRREVVAWVLAVVGDLAVEVVVERLEAGLADLGLAVDALQRVVDELAEEVVVLQREAEHPGDDVHRDVLGVLLGGVDDGLAGDDVAHVVEALAAEPADLGLPRLDLLGRERRQQEPAGEAVERRVAGDRRRRADRCLGVDGRRADDDGAAREVLGVVGDLANRARR